MSDFVFTGGCLCGAVRYRALGQPRDQTNCHCVPCRRASGAPYVTWASFDKRDVTIEGQPRDYHSSNTAIRRFCPACGTQLVFASEIYPDEIDLTVASMDEPEHPALHPRDHLWLQSWLKWVPLGDQLPRYQQRRGH